MKIVAREGDSILVELSSYQRVFINETTLNSFDAGDLTESEIAVMGIPYSEKWHEREPEFVITASDIETILWRYGIHTQTDLLSNKQRLQGIANKLVLQFLNRLGGS